MTRRRFVFTETHLHHLRAIRAQGLNFREASRELGVGDHTLKGAIEDSGFLEEAQRLYPRLGSPPRKREAAEGLRRLRPEQIKAPLRIPETTAVKWLTKPWCTAEGERHAA